jgi:YidC/Oxa1 family membrane protein insertase
MFAVDVFKYPAKLLASFYSFTNDYAISLALIGVVVILILTPLTLKSTKGMLEMQMLQPEMKRLQAEHRGDRQKLNEEMMKLYQERKVNPLASCLPLVAQMPIFYVMFKLISGLTHTEKGETVFSPKHLNTGSEVYQSLDGKDKMVSFGLDLAKTPAEALGDDLFKGLAYAALIVLLGVLYYLQQRLVANRSVSPTMNATQAKVMQYLPVAFAVFQIFLPTGLVIYYVAQTILRIVQQQYITQRFYKGEHSLGSRAADASAQARDLAGKDKPTDSLFRRPKADDSGAGAKRVDGRPVNPGRPGSVAKRPQPGAGKQDPGKKDSGQRSTHTTGSRPGSSRHPKPNNPNKPNQK